MLRKKLYLDSNDTIEALGITRRQLKYWEERGLIEPELGKGANRFTEADLERLQLIRQLIVEQHFPIDFVYRLLQGEGLFMQPSEIKTSRLLDLDSGEIVSRDQLSKQLWAEFGAAAGVSDIEERLLQLVLLLFRLYLARARNPESYKRQRDEILDAIRDMDLVARIDEGFVHFYGIDDILKTGDGFVLNPTLPDDALNGQRDQSFGDQAALRDLIEKHQHDLDAFFAVAVKAASEVPFSQGGGEIDWQRFLSRETLDLLKQQEHENAVF